METDPAFTDQLIKQRTEADFEKYMRNKSFSRYDLLTSMVLSCKNELVSVRKRSRNSVKCAIGIVLGSASAVLRANE